MLIASKLALFFGVRSERRKVDKNSKPTWKLKHANSVLGSFGYFCQISSKLILTIFELYRFKVGAFFETQCIYTQPAIRTLNLFYLELSHLAR